MSDSIADLRTKLQKANNGEPPVAKGAKVYIGKMIEVTVGELTKAIAGNQDHPIAKAWAGNLTLPENTVITVDRADLECLLDNKTVVIEREARVSNGIENTLLRKTVGEAYKAPVVEGLTAKKTNKNSTTPS